MNAPEPFGLATAAAATSPAGPTPALILLAERLSRTLAVARALVLAGRPLDLSGFDDGIGVLCAQTLDLPHDESRQMIPVLQQLAASVDQLGAVFAERLTTHHAPP